MLSENKHSSYKPSLSGSSSTPSPTHRIQHDPAESINRHEPFPLPQTPERLGDHNRHTPTRPPDGLIPILVEPPQSLGLLIAVGERLVDQFDGDDGRAVCGGGEFLREDGYSREGTGEGGGVREPGSRVC